MPLVLMRYRQDKVPIHLIEELAKTAPGFVAWALHCESREEAHLMPQDVEVWPEPYPPMAQNTRDVALVVLANGYEERRADLAKRRRYIETRVQRVIMSKYGLGLTCSVWVLPVDGASYGEF